MTGPRMHPPALVGHDELARAVVVFQLDLANGPLRSERALKLAEAVAALGVVHAVAQREADGVRAFAHERRDVVRFVEGRFVVFGPAGSEQVVARLCCR